MDCETWHNKAITRPPALPDALDPMTLKRLPATQRAELADTIAESLRGHPIRSPKHELLMEGIDQALNRSLAEPDGLRTYVGVIAPSGTGKTTQLTAWARYRYRQWIGPAYGPQMPRWTAAPGVEPIHAPVIWLSLNESSRASSLYMGILAALNLGLGGRVMELSIRAERAMRNHRVRLLVLDDAHQLHQGRKLNTEVLNAIQRIGTALGEAGGTLMMIAATGQGEGVFRHHQIQSRLWLHKFGAYTMRNATERELWDHFLGRVEERVLPYLPHTEPGFLVDDAELVWGRTHGFVGETAHLAIETARLAIAANRPATRKDLQAIPLTERARTAIADAAREARHRDAS